MRPRPRRAPRRGSCRRASVEHGGDRGPLGGDRRRACPRSRRSSGSRRAAASPPIASGRARLIAVSASSESRSTVGSRPAWASVRIASAPAANDGQRQPSYTLTSGSGRTRTVTAVITPNAPSEPRTSWRRSGPAALAGGAAEVELAARGGDASARRPARRSGRSRRSTGRWTGWPRSRRSWRTRSDCGKWPSVSPCSASSASASGPRRPGSRVAVIETRVDARAAASSGPGRGETTPANPSRPGGEAAGDRRAAAEGDHREVVLDGERRARRRPRRGRRGGRRRRGRRCRSPARGRSRSGVDLPRVRSRRVSSSVSTCSAPTQRAQPVEQLGRRGRGAGSGDVGRRPGRSSRPKASSTRPRAASGSGAARGRVAPAASGASRLRSRADLGHVLQCDT